MQLQHSSVYVRASSLGNQEEVSSNDAMKYAGTSKPTFRATMLCFLNSRSQGMIRQTCRNGLQDEANLETLSRSHLVFQKLIFHINVFHAPFLVWRPHATEGGNPGQQGTLGGIPCLIKSLKLQTNIMMLYCLRPWSSGTANPSSLSVPNAVHVIELWKCKWFSQALHG